MKNSLQTNVPNCPHLNQIENYENSFLVCTDCGLETQQIFCDPPMISTNEQWSNDRSFFKYTDKQFDFIDNCIRRDYIPDSCAYEIYDYYLKFKSKNTQKKLLNIGHPNVVAATAIYNWKIKNVTTGLTADDVSAITHVDKKQIFKCMRKRKGRKRFNNVKSILDATNIETLGLKHKDRLKIRSISSRFRDNDCNPKSIAAALTQIYCSLMKIKTTNEKIFKTFKISNMTLYRTKNKIQEKAISILTKMIEKNL